MHSEKFFLGTYAKQRFFFVFSRALCRHLQSIRLARSTLPIDRFHFGICAAQNGVEEAFRISTEENCVCVDENDVFAISKLFSSHSVLQPIQRFFDWKRANFPAMNRLKLFLYVNMGRPTTRRHFAITGRILKSIDLISVIV